MGRTEHEKQVDRAVILYQRLWEPRVGETDQKATLRRLAARHMLADLPDDAKDEARKIAKDAQQGGGAPTRVGRRADLKSQPGFDQATFFVKLTICGSGYGKWLTHTAELEPAWRKIDSNVVGYHRDRQAEGKGYELMLAGTGGDGTSGSAMKGLTDSGTNSIAELEGEACRLVTAVVDQVRQQNANRPIHVLLRAHSRGGVAGTMVVNDLGGKYKNLKIEVVNFDPVPGPEMVSSKKRWGDDDRYIEGDVSGADQSTIVYSIASGYGIFTPQQITGAKRIIVSKQNHSVGLAQGFIYEGRRYKGSALNSLPEGVFLDRNDPGESSKAIQLIMGRNEFAAELSDRPEQKDEIQARVVKRAKKEVRKVGKASPRNVDIGRMDIIDKVLKEYYSRT